MSKKFLIITILLLIVIMLIAYFVVVNNNGNNSDKGNQNTNPTGTEIQGMKVETLRQGSGQGAKVGDYLTTNYVGTLQDGKEFDSSIKRNVQYTFQLGKDRVIKGWDLGLLGMKVGETRKLTIPPELAYGLDGFPPTIPQNATLTYVIDLLRITPDSSK